MKNERNAWGSAVAAYGLWGIFPLYWWVLHDVPPLVVVCHRVVWSSIFLILVLCLKRERLGGFRWEEVRWYSLSAVALSANWLTFIYSVTHNEVLASSLGYFLAPLLYLVVAAVVFGETLSVPKKLAACVAAIAPLPLLFKSDGEGLLLSVLLAGSFVMYAALRRNGKLGSLRGLYLETLLLAPVSLFYLFTLPSGNATSSLIVDVFLVGAGPVTLIPLLFFAYAVRILKLSSMAFLQYIAPILQFLVAICVFKEQVTHEKLLSFTLVWSAIGIVAVGEVMGQRYRATAALAEEAE